MAGIAFCTSLVLAQQPTPTLAYADQGTNWTPAARAQFYSGNQGSELIPLAWANALTSQDGSPFMADALARYGYLPNPDSPDHLPVGFTVDTDTETSYLGMTCAACHTRQIDVDGQDVRIDGAPALSDFQAFLTDLRHAVSNLLASPSAFASFATKVLGPNPTPTQTSTLRSAVQQWDQTQGAFFDNALPTEPWGVGRLDAVSMIFNRISALDIGNPGNSTGLSKADAPVRYPFIWDAPTQDHTQWPGFAPNGDNLFALTRNLGEVYGVFAHFEVKRAPVGREYLAVNSAKIENLIHLEELVGAMGAPKWRWSLDPDRVARGGVIFRDKCESCHGERTGEKRLIPDRRTWATPLVDVGTDTREYSVLKRSSRTGLLRGEIFPPMGGDEKQVKQLQTVVIQTLIHYFAKHPDSFQSLFPAQTPLALRQSAQSPQALGEIKNAYHQDNSAGSFKYEARVLHGVWAVAPYLHNGSVQSLAQLLTPQEQRLASFPLGNRFDTQAVGLAKAQPGSAVRTTTGCDPKAGADLGTGNSRCGHSGALYGTDLPDDQKRDLIEFLKQY
jgi:hypothetical protein